jgi:hypothetical protein
MKSRFKIMIVLAGGLFMASCDDGVFDDEAAQGVIQASKLQLSGEQVLLTPDQVNCGEKKGLWTVDQIDGGGAIGRLTDAGRALAFSDDVRMGDRRFTGATVQLHGEFNVAVKKINSVTDESANVKNVDAKLGVIVKHDCLAKPLPLLGIDRGDFSEDASPRIRLRQRNGWTVDQILH